MTGGKKLNFLAILAELRIDRLPANPTRRTVQHRIQVGKNKQA